MSITTGVILVAAGTSRRFGRSIPKQFLTLSGEPLFMKSLRVFSRLKSTREIVIVTRKESLAYVASLARRLNSKKNISVVIGGEYRGESVKNGMKSLSSDVDVVLVHDAARPMVTGAIVEKVAQAAYKTGVALAAWPLPDTLKKAAGTRVTKTIPRQNLWLAQTPQGFRTNVAIKCLLRPSPTATDDVELAERKGYKVALVEGAITNLKVTFPRDLDLCRKIIA